MEVRETLTRMKDDLDVHPLHHTANRRKPLTAASLLFALCGDRTKASSRVRGYWLAEELSRLGLSCTLRHPITRLSLMRFLLEIPRHDAVVFQKTYSRYHVYLARIARALGKLVYIDIDDAPSRIQAATTLKHFSTMVRLANGTLAGSSKLVELVAKAGGKAFLMPSSIALEHYEYAGSRQSSDRVCLGWVGNGKHYADDLITTLPKPLATLACEHRIRLTLIGVSGVEAIHRAFGAIPHLPVRFVDSPDWSNTAAISAMINELDIGLYPLSLNYFNQFKCGFKALEYMAVGIPVIASPVGANCEIINSGEDGFLAETEADWIRAMAELVAHRKRRETLGAAGRKKIIEAYTVHQRARDLVGIMKDSW